jgi:hypothetical protein
VLNISLAAGVATIRCRRRSSRIISGDRQAMGAAGHEHGDGSDSRLVLKLSWISHGSRSEVDMWWVTLSVDSLGSVLRWISRGSHSMVDMW